MRFIQQITKTVYALVGILFVLVGGSVLLLNTGLLPEAARSEILDFAQGNGRLLHLLQEWGNAHLLIGLLTFWFIWRYDQSWVYHWAMIVFFAVDALIHWLNAEGPPESNTGPILNTVPLAVFVLLGLLRLWEKDGRRSLPAIGSGASGRQALL